MPLDENSLREVFQRFSFVEPDGQQYMPMNFVLSALYSLGLNPSYSDVAKTCGFLNNDNSSKFRWEAFECISHLLDGTRVNAQLLEQCFFKFDPSKTGKITVQELRFILQNKGESLSDTEINDFLEDCKDESCVDYQELIRKLCNIKAQSTAPRDTAPDLDAPDSSTASPVVEDSKSVQSEKPADLNSTRESSIPQVPKKVKRRKCFCC